MRDVLGPTLIEPGPLVKPWCVSGPFQYARGRLGGARLPRACKKLNDGRVRKYQGETASDFAALGSMMKVFHPDDRHKRKLRGKVRVRRTSILMKKAFEWFNE